LTRVLTNLVLNARDAMGSDAGRVTIVARKLPVGTSDYFTAPAEEECCITVADTGPGIPPAVAARLFEPLFTTKQSGTGLGLPVARQVVERHRGRICIDSDAERGAVFHIFLPAGSSPQKETPPPASTAAAARSFERRILLVEDDQTVAAGIAAVLEIEGFTAAVVHQAAAAIDTIATFRPDAVVLDVGLPDGDGVELYGLLAARWPDLPVILSTGHADESRLAGVRHRPHVAFLQKPYTVEALIGELDRLMSVAAN
jgi:two-component system cell cycle sensor histidine kinase/response regulator CckA